MKHAALFALLAGLALLTGLIAWQGVAEIGALLAGAGWGLLLVAAFHLVPIALAGLAWRSLLLGQGIVRPVGELIRLRWLADSINALLPVAQLGGEVVRGRLLMRKGVGGAATGSSIIVDLTLGLLSLIVYVLTGVLLLAAVGNGLGPGIGPLVAGVGMLGLMILALIAVQRGGVLMRLARLLEGRSDGRVWLSVTGGAAALDRALGELYRRRGPVLRAFLWRLAAWLGGAAETALALHILGHPVGWAEALILESLAQAVRNAGFAVPAGLGVQEGGLILAGALVGIGPDMALALALVRRMRDLVLGLPALAVWQVGEGRLLWRRRTGNSSGKPSGRMSD